MALDVQPQQQPPVRSLPASAASPPPNHLLRSRRRSSLPAVKTTETRPAKTNSPPKRNSTLRTQATSPHVISSLIDQLSAISIPAHNHFENLLVGYDSLSVPPSPSLRSPSTRTSFATHDGASVDPPYDDLYSDDACEPPVIRTSKPPSGLSPLTAPKKRDKPHSLSSYLGRSGGSSASLHSTHSTRSVSSFGNISIEAAPQRPPPTDSNRSSVESKRSVKAHRSLMYMSSRERLRLKETDRKRNTVHCLEDVTRSDTGRKPSIQLFPYEDTIKEEPSLKDEQSPVAESSKFANRYSSTNTSPRRLRLNLVDGPQGESPTEKGLIPERGSSLRHTGSPPRKNRRSRTDESIRESPHPTEMAVPGDETKPEEPKMTDQLLRELEQKEDNVAQRIRELKEQKMRRDKLAGKMPVDSTDAGAPPTPPRVSSFASPEPSPTSTVSSPSEIRVQDSTKAHKVLGIATRKAASEIKTDRLPEQSPAGDAEPVATAQTRSLRHSRHRSLTLNDGYDLTPLPIDYALALQHLEESALRSPPLIPPHESSPPFAHMSKDQRASTDITTKRRSSTMFNGRPTMGHRASTTAGAVGTTGSVPGHKHSSSATEATLNIMPLPFRSASEEITTRHQSMRASSSPPSSLKLQRRRTLTKKRWSHPDLPANVEKEPRDKSDRRSEPRAGAVQNPPNPVIEERPASIDSIDMDVDSYLNSPRLSQKIRHPQTGRAISFSEVGDPQGYAVFVCVGMGLTRYVMAFYDQLATTLKLRLITPDRPGIGGSQVDPNGTPLSWPDDVLVICQALKISKFSLLAHSAGAVYALATSLRVPQHIRGRVHLLAPWIPPSQMAPIGISQDSPPTQQLPRSQRFLRALPPSLLKVANSTFLSASSASLQRTGPKNSPKTKRKSTAPQAVQQVRPQLKEHQHRHSIMMMDQVLPNASSLTITSPTAANVEDSKRMQEALTLAERERQHAFDERLTFAIWDRATANANPATDLIVCLETKQTIGFRYEDINRPVVIHHGSKDSRVPVDNVRWLGRLMRKCEVRILEGEPHGLMASAQVMGNVLTEIASDWEDWTSLVNQKPGTNSEHRTLRRRTSEKLRSQLSMAV